MTDLQKKLFELQDCNYRDFHSRLMPTIEKERIIGIRTPVLRKFAKEFKKTNEAEAFLKNLPHKYYEENNLHAFLVADIADFDTALAETERFVPYIDNWATCDCFQPKAFKKSLGLADSRKRLLNKIFDWLKSDKTYTVRYGIGLLMNLFLDDFFEPEYMSAVGEIRSDEYYINMMIAWYFATALYKQPEQALTFITEKRLSPDVHRKAIQKAVESYRISDSMKELLKTYRNK